MSAAIEFQQAMADAGFPYPEIPIADGVIHRFHADGDSNGSKNAWYVFHGDGVPAGAFGSWKNGETHTWCAKRDGTLTESERAELRRRMDATRAERERQHAEEATSARGQAQAEWEAATVAGEHPYLTAKSVGAYGIRVDSSGQLVIPLRDTDGVIHSLQTISPDGRKLFLKGGAINRLVKNPELSR